MRWTPWILAAAIAAGIGSTATGQPCSGCNGGMAGGPGLGQWSLGCDPCCAPPGYCLAPGCCEYQRHCCDNAWAGYCQHRARVEAFWARAGVPKHRCGPCYQGYQGAEPSAYAEYDPCVTSPRPALKSAPRPEPKPAVRPLPRIDGQKEIVEPLPAPEEPKPVVRPLPPIEQEPAAPAVPPPPQPGKRTQAYGPALG